MSYKKYASDFKMEWKDRPGKKPKTVPVYYGPRFDYTAPEAELARLRRLLPLLSFPACAVFVLSLFLDGRIPRQIYVILPYFCSFLPHCYLCGAVGGFLIRRPYLTREQNDHIPRRIGRCAVALTVLEAYALCAGIAAAVINRASLSPAADFAFLACAAFSLVCAAILTRQRPLLATQEREQPSDLTENDLLD